MVMVVLTEASPLVCPQSLPFEERNGEEDRRIDRTDDKDIGLVEKVRAKNDFQG